MGRAYFVLASLVAAFALILTACGSDADGGKVSIAFSDLEGSMGQDLAGVLLSDTAFGGTAVGGFAVTVDSDPFTDVLVLGNVSEEPPAIDWPEPGAPAAAYRRAKTQAGLWPWASGVASIPAGSYTLRVAIGTDYCCYSRWVPVDGAPGTRVCEVRVTTSGEDQIIEVTSIPDTAEEEIPCGIGAP